MNKFINEAMHDFYKEQTFFNSARKFRPELKKQIIAFLQRRVDKISSRWGSDSLDVTDLKNMPTEHRKKQFIKIMNDIEINDKFFAAKTDYSAKISLPTIIYNNFRIEMSIKSNESFFDTGHDFQVEVKKTGEKQYGSGREFNYKINLMQSIPKVLNIIWDYVEKSIKEYSSTEKPKANTTRRRYAKSDIQRTVSKILNVYYKTYKNGKKVLIDDYEKMPAYFRTTMDKSSTGRTGNSRSDGFTLTIETRKLKSSTAKSSIYTKSSAISPDILERYPDIKEWAVIYNEADKEMSGRSYGRFNSVRDVIGDKIYTDDHLAVFKKLEFVVKKFAKMGYLPDRSSSGYGSGRSKQDASIHFTYNDKFKNDVISNDALLNKVVGGLKFRGHLKKAFFSKGKSIEDIPRDLINNVFVTLKRST